MAELAGDRAVVWPCGHEAAAVCGQCLAAARGELHVAKTELGEARQQLEEMRRALDQFRRATAPGAQGSDVPQRMFAVIESQSRTIERLAGGGSGDGAR